MYHMVRFFDRKKIVRRLQRAEKVCYLSLVTFKGINCPMKEEASAVEQGDKKASRKAEKAALLFCLLILGFGW